MTTARVADDEWLKWDNDADAARTFIEHLPAARKMSPDQVRRADLRLADAQSAIARKSGFADWPALAHHVEALRALEGEWRFDRFTNQCSFKHSSRNVPLKLST